MLAFYSVDSSLNPAVAFSFFCNIVFEKNKNKQRGRDWPNFEKRLAADDRLSHSLPGLPLVWPSSWRREITSLSLTPVKITPETRITLHTSSSFWARSREKSHFPGNIRENFLTKKVCRILLMAK